MNKSFLRKKPIPDKRASLLAVLSLFFLPVFAAEGEYAVSRIAPALLKNASAVLRTEEMRFELVSTGKAVYKYRYVITILDESADKHAEYTEYYDKFRKIASIEGVLYNAMGMAVKKIKTKDAEDLSGVDEGSLMDDNRVKHFNFYHRQYPYTVEYSTLFEFSSTLFFPAWMPQAQDRLSVEKSSAWVITPPGYSFRYKEFNYKGSPEITTNNGKQVMTWTVSQLPALLKEPYAPSWHEISPMVIFGPGAFEMDGYKGNMNSWADFGKFVYALTTGRDALPDAVKEKVRQLTAGLTDTRQKIAVLYEYLQKNTRYVSIQLGIGGWQPFDARFVAARSYGDCKALTNYMLSLLKEAGIPSRYTLVRAGAGQQYITADFPSQQFNHVILCVPLGTDSVWLECTSATLPAGYVSEFTCNRPALLIDENGGQLVRTPRYGIRENLQDRKIAAVLEPDGNLQVKAFTRYTGLQQDDIHQRIHHLSRDKIKESLQENLDLATYDISDFRYEEQKSTVPAVNENLEILVSNYATISGKRLFIVPNIMTRNNGRLAPDSTRLYDMVFRMDYRDTDTVEIQIGEGYTPESMPAEMNLQTKFGIYRSQVKLKGNTLTYYRQVERYAGRFPASDYPELVQFFDAMYKSDRARVVLVKEETKKGF